MLISPYLYICYLWDYTAAALILKEAGGTYWAKEEITLKNLTRPTFFIAASNFELLNELKIEIDNT